MYDLLLQTQVNGMNDVVFGIKDLMTIGGGIIGVSTAYLTLKFKAEAKEKADEKRFDDIEKLYSKEIEEIKKHNTEEIMNIQNGKRSMKKELINLIDKESETARKRIDKTQLEMKAYSEKTDQEFKEINNSISNVKQDTSEIKGMIQTLLNKH